MDKITQVYFSPGGTTERISVYFTSQFNLKVKSYNLLKDNIDRNIILEEDELLVVSMPVFAGRIPSVCPDILTRFRGNNTKAVVIGVYGNREFDDALLEMSDLLRAGGFKVIGAGAFIARHSVFPDIAKGRPDEKDLSKIREFANEIKLKLKNNDRENIKVPGNRPYKLVHAMLTPKGDSSCINCNKCVNICPTHAIKEENPRKTDKDMCIGCTACIYICPTKSRNYKGLVYKLGDIIFKLRIRDRKESSYFV